jgi:hypothetical protein
MTDGSIKESTRKRERPPDLFRAARNNDVEELLDAIAAGASFTDREWRCNRTPIHIAAYSDAYGFLVSASKHRSFDAWALDGNGHLPRDLALAKNFLKSYRFLNRVMYPPGWFLNAP